MTLGHIFALLAVALARPTAAPVEISRLVAEYGSGPGRVIVLEDNGHLALQQGNSSALALRARGKDEFAAGGKNWTFEYDGAGKVTGLRSGKLFLPRAMFPEDGAVFRIHAMRPVEQLRTEAAKHSPPVESGAFRKPDLLDLSTLDIPIHFDIRYASTNNFMGAPMYTQARAFLQRPAAEALARASAQLKDEGFGLLIHDAYRPWSVTWMFWEATPPRQRIFVANPAEGSRHNRGCAVDLSMYELASGRPVSMPSVYDEMTDRAYPNYPGGTSLQRWHRSLLREAMEKQGFVVNKAEWWHFDFKDWKQYPIGTARFEDLPR